MSCKGSSASAVGAAGAAASGADAQAVQVAVRIRPISKAELHEGAQKSLSKVADEPQVLCSKSCAAVVVLGVDRAFTFDHVLDIDVSQQLVYEQCVQPL
eukprot:2781169-Pleurochrysis_carterae.AAC.1